MTDSTLAAEPPSSPPSAPAQLASAIYQGTVRHRRFTRKKNHLLYKVFMVYLDLQEIARVFAQSRWWSINRFNLATFRRRDYLDGDDDRALYTAGADLGEQRNGRRPRGPIRMLTNLRYFGYIINPITCYYCFDAAGKTLETVVAEVTNTPWKQRTHYVLSVDNNDNIDNDGNRVNHHKHRFLFAKAMHVSPFQPMDLAYHWRGKTPDKDLLIHIDVKQEEQTVMDATMVLTQQPMTPRVMHRVLLRYPWMTLKVFAGIYWQALKLFIKGVRYHPNPKTLTGKIPH